MPETTPMPNYVKFLTGGASGMTATCIVQPMDLVKNRMQMSGIGRKTKGYKSSLEVFAKIVKNEGFLSCWKGLGAGLLRQATYTTTRMGVYQSLVDFYKEHVHSEPSVTASVGMGFMAGATGALVGNPAEVVLIRMTADAKLPVARRRNYKNVGDALKRIVRQEGITGLWKGIIPSIGRGMVINMYQLAAYSQVKNYFLKGPLQMQESIRLHVLASIISGFISSIVSMPLDIANTRLQNMTTRRCGRFKCRGAIDVLMKILKREGPLALWKGFTPYFARVTPHTILTFVFFEQYNNLYRKYVMGLDRADIVKSTKDDV